MADVLTMACEVVSALNAELPTTDHEYGDPIHDEERIVGVEFTWCIGPPDWVRPEAPRYHTEVVECVTRDMRGLGFTSKIVTWKRGSEPIIRCFTDNGVVFEWPVDEHLRSIYDLLANGRNVKVTLTKDDGEVIHYEKGGS